MGINIARASLPKEASVTILVATPFFQYLAMLFVPLCSNPATYISVPTTDIAKAIAVFVPSVSAVSMPFFQYLAALFKPLISYPAT